MRFSKKNAVDRGKSRVFWFFWVVLTLFLFFSNAAPPQKILSTNLCADFLLIYYVQQNVLKRERILALSPLLKRYGANIQSDLPNHRASVEDVLKRAPDIIITGAFDSPATKATLQKMGFQIYTLPFIQHISDIPKMEKDFLKTLGIAPELARKPTLPKIAKNPKRLLLLGASLIATGKKSFEDSLIRAAGFQNAVDFAGFQTLSMEQIIKNPPDFLLYTTPFETPSFATNILQNPVFSNIKKINTHNDWRWQCAGPWSWDLLENLKKISG